MTFKVPKLSGITMPDMRQLTVDATTMFSRAIQVSKVIQSFFVRFACMRVIQLLNGFATS